ncbi:ImmA/IrrE family metallo-endopeptidase [Negadavirga shengliensis]|uniref:ImmA/IrrE family metallo-endopeptidase n=1 Tax=Negadavirga shengliensis TaxID=1389218 RepID=A0ABV9T6T9_9BACT
MMIPKTRANSFLKEFKIKDVRGVEIEDLIALKGIFFEEADMSSCQANILSTQNFSKISINSGLVNYSQRRFALAHELGHYIMHRGEGNKFFSDNEDDFVKYHQKGDQEVEANEFAAELLMPRSQFRTFTSDADFNTDLIIETANYFESSITSTSIKYADVGHEPIAMIYTRNGRVKWKRINDSFPFSFIRNGQTVPVYSSVSDYYKNGSKSNSPVIVDAFNWFYEDFEIDKYPHAKLLEQIFYIDSLNSAIVYLSIKRL